MIEQEKLLSNPFPGLRPFRMEENYLFFGRDGQSDHVLTKLRTARFVAVVGTSGSGKSSLVSAGLLPALLSGHMPSAGSSWRIASFRPGSSPIRNLAQALSAPDVSGVKDKDETGERLDNIERTLRRSSLGLLEVVSQSKLAPGENLLILADQFEELFRFLKKSTAEHPEDETAAFVKLLLEAKQADKDDEDRLPIYVILTMRSDYLGECARYWGLPEAINEGQFLIPRMTDDNRREAITGPVLIGGGEITARLVNRLLNDAGDNPAQLPILQHALMRTWDDWKNRCNSEGPIDIDHYGEIGGMKEALSRHADEAYLALSPELQKVAAKVFKSLTEKEADNRKGRRPATIGEIVAAAEASEAQVKAVVESFRSEGRSFLMPAPPTELASDTLIDISHESLIDGWKRLLAWVDEEAEAARQYIRLADTAALFPDQEGYLRDPALSTGLKWLADNRPTKAWAQRYRPGFDKTIEYLELSKANRKAEVEEKERKHREEVERDLRHAEALAAGERRRVKLLNWGMVILLLLLLGMAGVTGYAVKQKNFAQLQKVEADKQKDRAEKALKDVEVQRDNATRSQKDAETQKGRAESALLTAETERDRARKAEVETSDQRDIAEQQRGQAVRQANIARAATIEANRQKALAEAALTEQTLARRDAERSEQTAVAATEAARQATTKAEAELQRANDLLSTIHEIDRAAPYFYAVLRGHQTPILSAWLSRSVLLGEAGVIITESADQTARMWNPSISEPDLVDQPYLADRQTTPVLYNKRGTLALLANYPGFAGTVIWDLPGRKELARMSLTGVGPGNTIISPDDRVILHYDTGTDAMVLFDAGTGQQLRKLDKSLVGKPQATKFSPDSRLVVNTNYSILAEVLDVATGKLVIPLIGHLDEVKSVSFSPDSKFVVTASKDGTARVWDARAGNTLVKLSAHEGAVNSAVFSENGKYIVTTSEGRAYLWETKSPATWTEVTENSPATLKGHTDTVTNAVFSPDGKWVATISRDRTAQLWDANIRPEVGTPSADSPASVAVFRGHLQPLTSVEFSADSKFLVTGSEDRTARVWDLRSFGSFTVAAVNIEATPLGNGGKCPVTVKITGVIVAQGRSGTVEYKFVRSDGSETLPQQLTFDGPESKFVSDTRDVFSVGLSRDGTPLPVAGWVELQILKPTPKSVRATFNVRCTDSTSQQVSLKELTSAQLQQIMPASTEAQRALYLPYLQKAMDEFGINTPLRRAAFLAEVAHITTELRILTELGPDQFFERYEMRKELGNYEKGDGARFKGRGAFLLTGRANYRAYSELLGVDLVAQPELAASPEVAFRTAALFWQKSGLNEAADKSDFSTIVRRITGTPRVSEQQQTYFTRAKTVFGIQ